MFKFKFFTLAILLSVCCLGFASAKDYYINSNDANGLLWAIKQANSNGQTANVIHLANNSVYVIQNSQGDAVDLDKNYGPTAIIVNRNKKLTIKGNGSVIRRNSTQKFRLLSALMHSTVILEDVTFENGHTNINGGGAAYFNYNTNVTIRRCHFKGNRTDVRFGGGIFIGIKCDVLIEDTKFTNNQAELHGGGLYSVLANIEINRCTFAYNKVYKPGYKDTSGGGAFIDGGDIRNGGFSGYIRVKNSLFEYNDTSSGERGSGGGAYLFAYANTPLEVDRCTFRHNKSAAFGGGIYMGSQPGDLLDNSPDFNNVPMKLTNSVIHNNQTGALGGGVWMDATQRSGDNPKAELRNCTIAYNYSGEYGGGLQAIHHGIKVFNCTIAYNTAKLGGGGIQSKYNDMQLRNSIIAFNKAQNQYDLFHSCGKVAQGSNNIQYPGLTKQGDVVCTNGIKIANPKLGPLKNNGGPTATMALLNGSPAINAGNGGYAYSTDQRGSQRVGTPDIGAYEFGGTTSGNPAPTPTPEPEPEPEPEPTPTPAPPSNSGNQQTLSPIDDAYLQGSTRYNNNLLRVEANRRVAYLKYDLRNISGNITKAQLKLFISGDAGSGNVKIQKGNSNNWTENNLSTSNRPGSAGDLGSLNTNYSTGQTNTWNLNASAISGGGYLTLIVTQTSGNDFAFASDENSQPAPQLYLEIDGNGGSTPAPSPSPSPNGDPIVTGYTLIQGGQQIAITEGKQITVSGPVTIRANTINSDRILVNIFENGEYIKTGKDETAPYDAFVNFPLKTANYELRGEGYNNNVKGAKTNIKFSVVVSGGGGSTPPPSGDPIVTGYTLIQGGQQTAITEGKQITVSGPVTIRANTINSDRILVNIFENGNYIKTGKDETAPYDAFVNFPLKTANYELRGEGYKNNVKGAKTNIKFSIVVSGSKSSTATVVPSSDSDVSTSDEELTIERVFDNPIRQDRVKLGFSAQPSGQLEYVLLDYFGRKVTTGTIEASQFDAQNVELIWNGTNLTPGTYFLQIKGDELEETTIRLQKQ